MSQRIVAFGEAMVEMAPTGEGATYRMGFAGDTLNTAWYLRHVLPAGWVVDYATAIGNDLISAQMFDFIAAAGIGTGFVRQSADRTVGLYLITLQGAERHFSYWRSQSAAKTFARDPAVLRAAMAGAGLIYFSGITLAILDPNDRATFLSELQAARHAGAKVAFDPNLRPKLWETPAAMLDWIMQGAAVCDIALPSYEDEAVHFGDADPAATAARYAQAGGNLVVVKNGPGAIVTLQNGATATFQPARVDNVIDTTAAGDSFNAGFLATYLTGSDLQTALRAGAVLSGHVIQARGALISVAHASEAWSNP